MRVLVTGGAGFIGSHLARHMVGRGHRVAIADKFSYAGKARNVADILPQVDLLIGSLSTGDLADRCAQWRPDWVAHLAGETHVDRAITDPFSFQHANVLGTCSLLEALRLSTRPPKAIVVYSTDEVYGPTPPGVAFKESQPFHPSNAYSASKCGVEGLSTAFYVTHGLPTMTVRPCNTYGPRQNPEKVIPKFTHQYLSGTPISLYNDGTGSRDWLHVEDHTRAVEGLLERGVPGQAYNLAAGEEHTDADISTRIHELLGKPPSKVAYVPGRPGHDRRYVMDGTKLREATGWSPEVPFDKGLADAVRWYAANPDYWHSDAIRLQSVGDGPCG